jgi:hypothetical protein
MPQYYLPFQRLDNYSYYENEGKTFIKSSLKAYLHAHENIQILGPVAVNPVTYYISLKVVEDTSKLADYQWESDCLVEIINATLYNPLTTPTANKVPIVRLAITQKLELNTSVYFFVEAEVIKPNSQSGGQVTNTAAQGAPIEIL